MADELAAFAADLGRATFAATRGAQAVVKKGATNIKAQLRDEASKSKHFKIARSITYDISLGGMSAVIGPEKSGAGNLANLAYFGGSNGGGGTVADPSGALNAEVPKFEKALLDAATEALL